MAFIMILMVATAMITVVYYGLKTTEMTTSAYLMDKTKKDRFE